MRIAALVIALALSTTAAQALDNKASMECLMSVDFPELPDAAGKDTSKLTTPEQSSGVSNPVQGRIAVKYHDLKWTEHTNELLFAALCTSYESSKMVEDFKGPPETYAKNMSKAFPNTRIVSEIPLRIGAGPKGRLLPANIVYYDHGSGNLISKILMVWYDHKFYQLLAFGKRSEMSLFDGFFDSLRLYDK
jgi:hypothetical protein